MLSFNLRIKRALVHADWQSSQHHSNAPSPPDHHLQRKRCRMEQRLHEGIPLPFSQLISSARDPSAPTVNIVVRSLTATAATQQSVDSTAGEQEDYGSDRLSRTLASQSWQGSGPFQSCSRSWAEVEAGPAAVAAAARQAVAVLEQQWQQLEQPTMPDMRRAKRRQRYNTLYPSRVCALQYMQPIRCEFVLLTHKHLVTCTMYDCTNCLTHMPSPAVLLSCVNGLRS